VPSRPEVSVVVPFAGGAEEAATIVAELRGLVTGPGDELIIADNSPAPVVDGGSEVGVVRAPELASSYYARNRGAERATGEWLLFVDSDCLLPPTLLDDFFAPAPAERCGIVAGEIEGDPAQGEQVPRYMRSRGHLAAGAPLSLGPSPAVGTANMLVRRAVWEQLGGFAEVVSGADFEFSWRAGARGWEVERRPGARVQHRHPLTVAGLRAKSRRYGAGQRWANERFEGANSPPSLARELTRSLAGAVGWTVTGRFERGRFKALDGLVMLEFARGYRFGDNRANRVDAAA
jgi:cellulose synthase/poly-beta-1,6-N-acetylglucosamine synthase-like glycosyltransferase